MPKHRDSASREVASKSAAQIERETAAKWLARAIACWGQYVKTVDLRWRARFDRYADEALEHGAMVGDHGKTVAKIQRALDGVKRV